MARAKKTSSAVDAVAGAIKPPISFKEFSKDPVKGLMFICIVAVGYLYVDIKMSNEKNVGKQDVMIQKLESKVDTLQLQVVKLVSESSALNSKIEVLESLKQIPK
jgi:archaellum component FlaF (FlaF/FlaG flagellin family)